ncbi:MAG TPA: SynChlorMet cassette protein ScmC [Syntrophales bacterium]|nr:SynChlorMet cassette protein ScmC [Syntrophales bacterium]HOX93339.1 SynChlorMet cassette protein ScmC [Syntrophales bacterium]HPI56540.1 SynChlorMet cassette protein ScmC [Syntrophales bacterium]HPN25039.1 SynChlorMet cassette protein ScmC [Syntrophales bacterium]HQM29218.1 SynChlorMet cassette protein ScmC [Syntrophales bacterium]
MYSLELADGSHWGIGADGSAASCLAEFSRVMELRSRPNAAQRHLWMTRTGAPSAICSAAWTLKDLGLIRLYYHKKSADIVCDLGPKGKRGIEITRMQMALFPIFEGVQEAGGVPLHAALIERDGMGFVIAARGGTGKSTCCARIPPPWNALCDDETVIARSPDGIYMAHPFPTWSRYIVGPCRQTWKVEKALPLRAIFFLDRAATRDEVIPIKGWESAVRASCLQTQILTIIWLGLDRENLYKQRTCFFNNMAAIAGKVPSFVLRASLEGAFWEEMESVSLQLKGPRARPQGGITTLVQEIG